MKITKLDPFILHAPVTREKIADSTTYKQLGSEADATALADLRQRLEAAGNACR